MKKIEICILCGFVHRDDRTQTRQKKTHYHWQPAEQEVVIDGCLMHATICHSCVGHEINWLEFSRARQDTVDEFYLRDSYNASLPDKYKSEDLNKKYADFVKAIQADWEYQRKQIGYIDTDV